MKSWGAGRRRRGPNLRARRRRGNCYVTCEALYHLLGGSSSRLVPHSVRHEGGVHWYLVRRISAPDQHGIGGREIILDPTASQFHNPPPYNRGRGRGFLTKRPSKRAKALMQILLWQEQSRPATRSDR